MSKRSVIAISARKAQGYERNPPRCHNCMSFENEAPRQPARCHLGGFVVKANAICDHWFGRKGETLE